MGSALGAHQRRFDALGFDTDPMVLLRPEGDWDRPGILDRSAGRPAKIGVFERAHGGTLYLDEAADMPRETQGRILRVLVEQRFRRVGFLETSGFESWNEVSRIMAPRRPMRRSKTSSIAARAVCPMKFPMCI